MLSERTLEDVLDQKSEDNDYEGDEDQFHSDVTPGATQTAKKLDL